MKNKIQSFLVNNKNILGILAALGLLVSLFLEYVFHYQIDEKIIVSLITLTTYCGANRVIDRVKGNLNKETNIVEVIDELIDLVSNDEDENLEPEDLEPENLKPEDLEPENLEPENLKPENLEPENLEPENLEPENLEPENLEPENLESENLEPENLESENLESENVKQ